MTMNQARLGLFWIFVFCLLVELGAYLRVGNKMWPEDLRSLVFKLLAIYSVHIGVIVGGIFARPKGPLERPSVPLVWVAIVLATFWNLLFLWRSIVFTLATEDSATEVMKFMDGAASASSFLVTGALAFFFTKGTETAKSAGKRVPPKSSSTAKNR